MICLPLISRTKSRPQPELDCKTGVCVSCFIIIITGIIALYHCIGRRLAGPCSFACFSLLDLVLLPEAAKQSLHGKWEDIGSGSVSQKISSLGCCELCYLCQISMGVESFFGQNFQRLFWEFFWSLRLFCVKWGHCTAGRKTGLRPTTR